VGIDVKNNSAGFVVVGSNGQDIRFHLDTSSQKEKLDQRQVKRILADILRKEAAARHDVIRNVVLHRDGKAFPEELAGAREAISELKGVDGIAENLTLTVLEIQKTSPAPLRLFEVTNISGEGQIILNPQVGYYYLPSRTEGYLCATGRAFRRNGTVKPLHVRLVEGPMPIEFCLEDVYALTALAWTRPEDCTRYPITIKLNDRYLAEEAGKFDEEAFEEILAKVKGAAR
jgi:argonaute-like protein implicated in RNA metabolism and viral defense